MQEETPKKYIAYIYNVTGSFTSDLGNYVASNMECDFVIIWSYNHNDEKYSYSLRSIDSKADVSIIANGFFEGKSLNELINEFPESVLGTKVYKQFGKKFPLLF